MKNIIKKIITLSAILFGLGCKSGYDVNGIDQGLTSGNNRSGISENYRHYHQTPENQNFSFEPESNSDNEANKKPICGDYKCESSENYNDCPYDCEAPCFSEICNPEVQVYCDPKKECSNTNYLFSDYLKFQTVVYRHLSVYFDFNPVRVNYKISGKEWPPEFICSWGGITYPHFVTHPYIPGCKENDNFKIVPDIHEITHHFLYHLLPTLNQSWFHEAVAFQTEMRLGKNIFPELLKKVGIGREIMDLAVSQEYDKIKNNECDIPTKPHPLGHLFIYALEKEYGCKEECLAEICKKLYEEYIGGLSNGNLLIINNDVIKKTFSETLGKDVEDLFDWLNIN